MRHDSPGVGRRRAPWAALALFLAVPADAFAQRPRGNAPVLAIEVGTVHPVSGPAIEAGIILVRGNRIIAVGAAGDVDVPGDATRISYPDGHAYPGLVDAMSTAFCEPGLLSDASTNAGTEIVDGLDPYDAASADLVAHGVTTAYVSNRSTAQWRGLGCVIRPLSAGVRVLQGRRVAAAQLRMTAGEGAGHALDRRKRLAAFDKLFDGLDAYDKAFEEFAEKKKEYDEKFEAYLEYHRTHKDQNAAGDAQPDDARRGGGTRSGRGNRQRPPTGEQRGGAGRGGRGGGRPPGDRTRRGGGERGQGRRGRPTADAGGNAGAGADASAEAGDKPPERPTYPKEPQRDPAKEALKKIKAGDLTLRIECHRAEEIAAALALARDEDLRAVILEQATGGAPIAQSILDAGVPVIVTRSTPPTGTPYVDEEDADLSVVATLSAAGVPVAIGSGSLRRSRHLPLVAAEAVGYGLDPEAAVRAITLTPAELLGVDKQVGSLEPRKLADIVITSGPLLRSDSRILRVIAGGRTEYEADQ